MIVGVGLAVAQQVAGIDVVICFASYDLQVRPACHPRQSPSSPASASASVTSRLTLVTVPRDRCRIVDNDPCSWSASREWRLSLAVLGLASRFRRLFPGGLGWLALASLMVYVGSFAVGLGPVFWLMLSEIYPLRIRGRAMSIGTLANWAANLIVAVSFLTLTQTLGKPITFWLFGLISIGAWVFAFALVPETKGRSLEQIEAHWKQGKHPRAL